MTSGVYITVTSGGYITVTSGPSVAQLVEHGACNARVVGSIPGTTHT